MVVLVVGSGVGKLCRHAVDVDFNTEGPQAVHVFPVKISHRTGLEWKLVFQTVTGLDGKLVRQEIELDFKRLVPKRNRRGAQAARRYIERNVPPMVLQGREHHARLAHDLCPHVKRVAGGGPIRERKRRPFMRRQVPPRPHSTSPNLLRAHAT